MKTFHVNGVSNSSSAHILLFLCQERKFPKFVSKEMENMYIEELKSSVNLLMANLESMPVSKGGEFKLQKLKRSHNASIIDMGEESENQLSKSDVVLSFSLEVKSSETLASFLAPQAGTGVVRCITISLFSS